MEKYIEYSMKIQEQIAEMFTDDCEYRIKNEDFTNPENVSAFFLALSVCVPCAIYNKLTDQNLDHLQFNHLSNHLVFDVACENK